MKKALYFSAFLVMSSMLRVSATPPNSPSQRPDLLLQTLLTSGQNPQSFGADNLQGSSPQQGPHLTLSVQTTNQPSNQPLYARVCSRIRQACSGISSCLRRRPKTGSCDRVEELSLVSAGSSDHPVEMDSLMRALKEQEEGHAVNPEGHLVASSSNGVPNDQVIVFDLSQVEESSSSSSSGSDSLEEAAVQQSCCRRIFNKENLVRVLDVSSFAALSIILNKYVPHDFISLFARHGTGESLARNTDEFRFQSFTCACIKSQKAARILRDFMALLVKSGITVAAGLALVQLENYLIRTDGWTAGLAFATEVALLAYLRDFFINVLKTVKSEDL